MKEIEKMRFNMLYIKIGIKCNQKMRKLMNSYKNLPPFYKNILNLMSIMNKSNIYKTKFYKKKRS